MLKRVGFKFGQPVSFDYSGRDRKGFVLGVITVSTHDDNKTVKSPYLVISSKGLGELKDHASTVYLPVPSVKKYIPKSKLKDVKDKPRQNRAS